MGMSITVCPCTGSTAPVWVTTSRVGEAGSSLLAIEGSREKIAGTSVYGSVKDGATVTGILVRIRA